MSINEWASQAHRISYNVFGENVHTRPKGSDGHPDTWYGEILRRYDPIANTGVWDGALTSVNEENGVVFWTVSVRMEWHPDPCQWGWGGTLNYVNEENEVLSWTMSMKKMRLSPDLSQWNQTLTGYRRTQEALLSASEWTCGSNQTFGKSNLTHLQRSLLKKTWLSCSSVSCSYLYFSDVRIKVWAHLLVIPLSSCTDSLAYWWETYFKTQLARVSIPASPFQYW